MLAKWMRSSVGPPVGRDAVLPAPIVGEGGLTVLKAQNSRPHLGNPGVGAV